MTTKKTAFSRKSICGLGACILLLAVAATTYIIVQQKILYHLQTVDPGKLYRSGTLSARGLEKAHSLIGMRTIVNLRSEQETHQGSWYQEEKKFAEAKGINLVNIPLLPDTPPTPSQIRQFLDIMRNPDMLPVLVHCEMGVIRTGMMVAVYRIAVQQETNRKVVEELPMFGHSLDKRPAVKEFMLSFVPH